MLKQSCERLRGTFVADPPPRVSNGFAAKAIVRIPAVYDYHWGKIVGYKFPPKKRQNLPCMNSPVHRYGYI